MDLYPYTVLRMAALYGHSMDSVLSDQFLPSPVSEAGLSSYTVPPYRSHTHGSIHGQSMVSV